MHVPATLQNPARRRARPRAVTGTDYRGVPGISGNITALSFASRIFTA
jgi:hypothetical protein